MLFRKFYIVLACLWLPLAPAVHASRGEVLTTLDCEEHLLGPPGRSLLAEVLARLEQMDGFAFNLYLSVELPEDRGPSSLPTELFREENLGRPEAELRNEYRARVKAKAPGLPPSSVAPFRYNAEEMREFWREESLRSEKLPLSPLTAAALGVEPTTSLKIGEVQHVLAFAKDQHLHLLTETNEGRIAGEVRLPLRALTLGFANFLAQWQAARFSENARRFRRQARAEKLREFLYDEGVALLTLERGRIQFGYRFDIYELLRNDPDRLLAIDFVTVTPAARQALGSGEIIFPTAARRSGTLNLRNTSLGVELLGISSFGDTPPF